MGGKGDLWTLGGALTLLPHTVAAEQNTAILPLLGPGEGLDWDANIMPPATRMVGIAAHLMLGLRGLPPHK